LKHGFSVVASPMLCKVSDKYGVVRIIP